MSSSKFRKRRQRKQKSNTKKIALIIALLAIAVIVIAVYNMPLDTSEEETLELTQTKVLFVTSMGNITIQLRDDMPITTTNFKNLVYQGIYNNTIFHRVIADFMIQGGDPNGNGISDDGLSTIEDEFTDTNENNRGTIAMANTGEEDSGCSQFFINVVDNSYLDDVHPVFGEVIDGMDVVDAISIVETDSDDKPVTDVTLISATLID